MSRLSLEERPILALGSAHTNTHLCERFVLNAFLEEMFHVGSHFTSPLNTSLYLKLPSNGSGSGLYFVDQLEHWILILKHFIDILRTSKNKNIFTLLKCNETYLVACAAPVFSRKGPRHFREVFTARLYEFLNEILAPSWI